MPSANAAVKAKEMKVAQKKILAAGVPKPPKHVPKGDSGTPVAMVESGHSTSEVGVGTENPTRSPEMTQEAEMQVQAGRRATDPMVDVANAVTNTKTKKEIHAEEVAERKKLREAEALQRKADREAREAVLKAEGKGYVGSMLSLAERVKAGAYVKSMTGQLRSTDELAVALDAVPPKNVILLALEALKLDTNPYVALNVGQQSMNLRNKLRGALKAGTLTIDAIKAIRDSKGYATAEAERAAKAEAKEAAAKKREEEKAAKAAAADKAKQEQTADAAAKQAETNAKAQIAAERQSMDEQSTQVKSTKPGGSKKK